MQHDAVDCNTGNEYNSTIKSFRREALGSLLSQPLRSHERRGFCYQ